MHYLIVSNMDFGCFVMFTDPETPDGKLLRKINDTNEENFNPEAQKRRSK